MLLRLSNYRFSEQRFLLQSLESITGVGLSRFAPFTVIRREVVYCEPSH